MTTRRNLLATLVLAAAPGKPGVWAQPRAIRVIVGFTPGGSADVLARMVAESLQSSLNVSAIVENKPGAAGRLAVDTVKNAAPDGATLLFAPQGPITMFPFVFRRLNYDPARDFIPVTRVASGDFALCVGPLVPVSDLAAFGDWLKAPGAKASYGSPGAGTVPHFVGVAVGRALGAQWTHVPYRGSALAVADVAGGNIAAAITPLTEALEMHRSGRVRILATTGSQRSRFIDGVPTFKERGLDVDAPLWFGLYAPAATPAEVVDRMRTALHAALLQPATREKMARLGLTPAPTSSAEQLVLQRREAAMWEPLIKASGFSPED